MSSQRVIIIGGGLAGLSSAIALAESGFEVRLLESRPHLGGRATSYDLPDGTHVDNCQHVTMGCCTNLEDFYRRVGASAKIRSYDELYFADSSGCRAKIGASSFPAPFHLAPSFASFPFLSWPDKRAIARAMLAIVRHGFSRVPEGTSMLDWLREQGQTQAAIERFWRVVLVSALNEELDRTDARFGIDVFWKGFLSHPRGFRVGIPCVPLAELYDGCRREIEKRGGQVDVRAAVRKIQIVEGAVRGVSLDNGKELPADWIISAVPQDALLKVLPESLVQGETAFRQLAQLNDSPITGVHFWFDREVMQDPFLTLLDRTTQWIFNKSRLFADAPASATEKTGQYLQLVISASYDLVPRSRQEIIDLCLEDLRNVLPEARGAQLVKATVIKEAHATFSPAPGCDRWRPRTASPVRGLFLAGDWTATGWPATMEGAVRSGYLAAEAVMSNSGQARKFLCDDLPVTGLSKLLSRT